MDPKTKTQEILRAIERGVEAGEGIPPELVLWLARFSRRLDQQVDDDELRQELLEGDHPEFPKSQAESWEACSTKLAAVVVDLVEALGGQGVDPLVVRSVAALNGYNAMAAKPFVELDEAYPDVTGPCRVCQDVGKIPLSRCPACDQTIAPPSTRVGMPMDMRPLAEQVLGHGSRKLLTEHEVDAVAVGYYMAVGQMRAEWFPDLVVKVWEDWGSELCKPHVDRAPYVDQPALPEGPVGPETPVLASTGQPLQAPVIFRALRNDPEDAFLVARMKPGQMIAKLDAVQHVVCSVETEPGEDRKMRVDYRAAEAFAALLTALPALVTMAREMDQVVGGAWIPEAAGELDA